MSRPVAVALSSDVPPSTSIGTRVHGAEYVVWRDAEGQPHIWDDRCPHRGMKMSLGFVRGDGIACLYHGWEYAPDGQCRKIPAHPDLKVPSTIRIGTHPVAERAGLIWMGFDDEVVWPEDRTVWPVRSMLLETAVSINELEDAPPGINVTRQPVSDRETGLHITVDDPSDAEAAFMWSQRLRLRLERRAA